MSGATTARFDYRSVIARVLFSGFFVFATYNPSGYSYFHWLAEWSLQQWEMKVLVGLLLSGMLAFLAQKVLATLRLRGALYIVVTAVATSLVLAQAELIDLSRWETWTNIALLTAVALLTTGLSIAHVSHRLAGIQHTDEIAR